MNKEQIAFEKAFVRQLPYIPTGIFRKIDSGNYYESNTQFHWETWQARAALDKQDSLELVKEIDEELESLRPRLPTEDTQERFNLLTKIRNYLTN